MKQHAGLHCTDPAEPLETESDGLEPGPDARRKRLDEMRKELAVVWQGRSQFRTISLAAIGISLIAGIFVLGSVINGDVTGVQGAVTLGTVALAASAGWFYYTLLGRSARECIRLCIQSNEPAAAACIAGALRHRSMPEKTEFLDELAALVARIGPPEWDIMSQDDVSSIIACATDKDYEFAARIGLAAARSASEHEELRAIPGLRTAIRYIKLWIAAPEHLLAELNSLLGNLQAKSTHRKSINALLRPADGNPQLLRAAADASSDPATRLLVQPVEEALRDERATAANLAVQ